MIKQTTIVVIGSLRVNNIIFIGLYSTFQNFRFRVKCSVFVSSTFDMQKQDLLLIHDIVIN